MQRVGVRLSSIAATLALALSLAVGGGCSDRPEPARPDILLISIDSLRPDHLGCYGYAKPTSPVIDALAANGVRCASAVSTTSWTLPAHAAMFTGLYDSTHGVVDNGLALADAHRTLAEVLRENGYQTAGFFGGPYLHPTFGLGQGFEHYQSCMTKLADDVPDRAVRDLFQRDANQSHEDVTGPRTVEELARWLGRVDERPLFAFVHLWDVHYDYIPPREYVELFDPDYEGSLDPRNFAINPAIRRDMPARDLEHLIALYDGEIRFTDDIVGRILDALRQRGRLENTLVVITADHGEEFFEHGQKGHHKTLFEEVVRVPLVFHWPAQLAAGRVVQDQVQLVDLMPTLLTLAGVAEQPLVQGRDIGPLLAGSSLSAAPALCELLLDKRNWRALRANDVKVHRIADSTPSGLVFDLSRDPGERTPLAPDDPRLKQHLSELDRALGRALEFQREIGRGVRAIDVDAAMQKRLQGLGYTGDDEPK